ncbi:FAD-dependent oxidoreductase [Oculatella sp. FACHB-28]|uniref:flavin monoamine oxidase family protein n=1 Tax=Cyanophyceae TaxID=3028117 RepID=UPI0016861272|nr:MULTISPECIES: FAD-dependent oxidoreductase [Cyanophyceae]MBD1997340.1 FAD-dependent oxidoreductase [Leptolyngbya sp. FACHB-541]MBD2055359.1 FAD-dependent oxidoreductase [Oculatella sp. FACHB-28]
MNRNDKPSSTPLPQISRRWLLRSLALASGAAFTSRFPHIGRSASARTRQTATKSANLLNELEAVPNPRQPLKVIILGAGMAGLCAAYELEKRGHTCVILEAERNHIGGRVRTLRFEDGLYGDVGASRIPKRHNLTHHYIRECGLQLRSYMISNPEGYYYLREQRIRVRDAANLSRIYNLGSSERGLTPNDILGTVVGSRLAQLTESEKAEIFAERIHSAAVREMDEQSMLQWSKASGFSNDAIEMMAAANGFLGDVMYFSALSFIRVGENYDEMEEIVGGSDRLPAALADKLKSKPRMGCEVIQLERDDETQKAAAVYLEENTIQREEGDFVLCTIPFPVLSRLDTPFSAAKQRAIRELSYDSATKVLAVVNSRFWETDDGIYGGSTASDLPISTLYYPSDNAQTKDPAISANPSVLLAAYTMGSQARRLANLPPQERHRIVQQNLAKIHPQINQNGMIRQMESWSWDDHPWSLGSWAMMKPYQQTSLYADVITPEGHIYFAGEHASTNQAWMQSALESSLKAVKEILVAAQLS